MKSKMVVRALLLAFAIGSVVYMVAREGASHDQAAVPEPTAASADMPSAESPSHTAEQPIESAPPTPAEASPTIMAYYFHGDMRCLTCIKLETYAHEALETRFADELTSGRMAWQAVNTDRPENAHFVTDFKLVSKSVVLVEMDNGQVKRWKNLDQIWDKVGDKAAYTEYIQAGMQAFLGAGA